MSFSNKYKERTPEETIAIIKNFFLSKPNFTIREAMCEKKDNIDLWSCGLELYYNNNLILTSNGKGVNKNYAFASGYGELYERFCNKTFWINNPFAFEKIINLNYKNNGYYLDKEEHLINYEEAIAPFFDYIDSIQDTEKIYPKKLFTSLMNNKFIGIPYTNILNNEKLFIDPRMLYRTKTSSGMSAGNSFYEAFNQGMSELCEHYIAGRYLYDPYNKYYQLNLNNIKNTTLQKIISQIQADGNDLYIYDFSYNCNLPVLMSLLLNHRTKSVSINIGSFPVFDIALERVLTELYQGSGKYDFVKTGGHVPYYDKTPLQHYRVSPSNTTLKTSFPENFIINAIQVENYNNKVFLDNNEYTNENIYNYYKQKAKELNLSIYYYNHSLNNEIYAIQIFSPELESFTQYRENKNLDDKEFVYLFVEKLYNILNNPVESILLEEIKILLIIYSKFNIEQRNLISMIMGHPWLTLFNSTGNSGWPLLLYILAGQYDVSSINKILEDSYTSSYYKISKKYLLLAKFCCLNKYSSYELLKIFEFLKMPITSEDLQNWNNSDYLLEKIFINPFLDYYHSDHYDEYFINIFKKE